MRLSQTVPALPVRDVAAAAAHYRERFAFTVAHESEDLAVLLRDEAEVHLWHAGDTGWPLRPDLATNAVCTGAESFLAGTASCRIAVDDVDALHVELSRAGVLHPVDTGAPTDTEWGTREFPTLDLDGNLLTFFRRLSPR